MDTPSKIAYSVTADSTGGRAGTSSVPALGISHVYASPVTTAAPGSTHGYDVVDPATIKDWAGLTTALETVKAAGKKGISAFVIERGTPGFRPGKKEDKLGVRSSDTSELVLEDCRVPAANLLGQEGNGFIDTLRILDRGRIVQSGTPLGDDRHVRIAARDAPSTLRVVRALEAAAA